MSIKIHFSEKYRCKLAANLIPHITLYNCRTKSALPSLLTEKLSQVIEKFSPFTIHLDGIGKFPSTIFVKITEQAHLNSLGRILKKAGGPILPRLMGNLT